MVKESVVMGIRVPAELAEWLKSQARGNMRSVSGQAVWTMDQYRTQQQAQASERQFAHGAQGAAQ